MVGIFPYRNSLIRLVGTVLSEPYDDLIDACRYLGLDLIQRAQAGGTPTTEVAAYTPELALRP